MITPKSILLLILIIFALMVCSTVTSSDDWYNYNYNYDSINENLVNIGNIIDDDNNTATIVIPKNKINKLNKSDTVYQRLAMPDHGETCKAVDESVKCSSKSCGINNLYPILDPRFNMRESAKQCLLLEDHLNNKQKRCVDCIRKHFLIIDGLLEEAVSLEKDINKRDYYRNLYVMWVNIEKQYANSPSDSYTMDNVSKSIRSFRKPLVEEYFDMVSEYET